MRNAQVVRRQYLVGVAIMLAVAAAGASQTIAPPASDTRPMAGYTRTSWTANEGLLPGRIWAITQDADGYLWLGTDAGLSRFDGVRFVGWDSIGDRPVTIGPIRSLRATRSSGLWVGLRTGGLRRIQQGQLTVYDSSSEAVPDLVQAILEDREGNIWAGGFSGLSRFRDNRWVRIDETEGLSDQTFVRALYEDRDGTIWVASRDGIYRRPIGARKFEHHTSSASSRTEDVQRLFVSDIGQDHSGRIWFAGLDRTFTWEPNKAAWSTFSVRGSRLIADRHGTVWLGTLGKGVAVISPADAGRSVEFVGVGNGLMTDVVRAILEDREGNVWIGTQNELHRFSSNTVVQTPEHLQALGETQALATAKDGRVWIAVDASVYRVLTGPDMRLGKRIALPADASAFHVDVNDRLWVATARGDIGYVDNDAFVPLRIEDGPVDLNGLTTDATGTLWLSSLSRGVIRFHQGTIDSVLELRGKKSLCIIRDHTGRVWSGFSDGTVARHERGAWRTYTQEDGLLGDSVNVLFEDRSGRIWAGTNDGLIGFNGTRFASMTSQERLPIGPILAIVQDAEGFLWLGSTSGAVRVRIEELAAGTNPSGALPHVLYDTLDGMRGVPAGYGSTRATVAGDGRVWFSAGAGVAVLDPSLVRRREPPASGIERLSADNRVADRGTQIVLPPRTAHVQLEYTGRTLTAATRVQFRYRLEGFDQDWIYAGPRRFASYTNLPPLDYRFTVNAGIDGVWNDDSASLAFSIQPAIYQTAWFRAAVLGAVLLAVFGAFLLRARHIREGFVLILGERTRVAREIHDNLLQGLVGVGFQFDVLLDDIEQSPQAARDRIARLRDQVQMYVREARQSIWALRSPTLETRELATAVRDVCATIAGTSVSFQFDVTGVAHSYAARTEEAILRVCQEAVSNAVRHAHAPNVRVQMSYSSEALAVRISDDGTGFDVTRSQDVAEHWGLASMQERARQAGLELSLASRLGHGTEVNVRAHRAGAEAAAS
jgi:signal transduction histidine kinase/ligand-binding sensor domain-containing protein